MTATPAALTWTGVMARRMARHALAERPPTLARTTSHLLCGAHAQVLSAAELSIGRRIAGATRAGVQHALWQRRTLVKTFGPRGTVHLLPAADLPMWTGALSALPSSVQAHPEGVRFTPGQADEVIAAIGDALAEAELTVDELTEALADRAGPWAVERTMDAFGDKWPRWRQLTGTAAHRGVLCFGPDRGRKVTYTNPHRWLPGFRPADGEEALRTLLTRYLHAYGPATPAHFARWIGIPPRHAAAFFGRLAGELERVELDGEPGWTRRRRHGSHPGRTAASACCPTSTPMSSRASPGSGSTRGPQPPARSPRRARPGTTRSCWSTAWSAGSGTSGAPAPAHYHGGAAGRADRAAAPRTRRRGLLGGRGHGGHAHADGGPRDRRPARVNATQPHGR